MYDEINAFPHNAETSKKHKYLEDTFNRRVYTECPALMKLHNYDENMKT